jgi:hypothetical protein
MRDELISKKIAMIDGHYHVTAPQDVMDDIMQLGLEVPRVKFILYKGDSMGPLTCTHHRTVIINSRHRPDKWYRAIMEGKPKVLGIYEDWHDLCPTCYPPEINPRYDVPIVFESTDRCMSSPLGPFDKRPNT